MIHCFGDSITKGSPGVSYVQYLDDEQHHVNHGLGGDTLIGISKRVLDHMSHHDDAHYVLQMGTNDLLLPFLLDYSKSWRLYVQRLHRRGSIPCKDVDDFEHRYHDLLQKLIASDKKLILINIPCIGEDIDSPLNHKADQYNRVIQQAANTYDICLVDFNASQKEVLKQHAHVDPFFISKDPKNIILDVLTTKSEKHRNTLSERRKLVLTVDGVHLNDKGALLLARSLMPLLSMIDK